MSVNNLWHVSRFRDDFAASVSTSSAAAARDAKATAEDVEERIDKLALIVQAMWELIRSHTKLTEADLIAKVQELDIRDGQPDGKITRRASKCPDCNRTMSPRHQRCLYCGYEKLIEGVFEGL